MLTPGDRVSLGGEKLFKRRYEAAVGREKKSGTEENGKCGEEDDGKERGDAEFQRSQTVVQVHVPADTQESQSQSLFATAQENASADAADVLPGVSTRSGRRGAALPGNDTRVPPAARGRSPTPSLGKSPRTPRAVRAAPCEDSSPQVSGEYPTPPRSPSRSDEEPTNQNNNNIRRSRRITAKRQPRNLVPEGSHMVTRSRYFADSHVAGSTTDRTTRSGKVLGERTRSESGPTSTQNKPNTQTKRARRGSTSVVPAGSAAETEASASNTKSRSPVKAAQSRSENTAVAENNGTEGIAMNGVTSPQKKTANNAHNGSANGTPERNRTPSAQGMARRLLRHPQVILPSGLSSYSVNTPNLSKKLLLQEHEITDNQSEASEEAQNDDDDIPSETSGGAQNDDDDDDDDDGVAFLDEEVEAEPEPEVTTCSFLHGLNWPETPI